MVQIFPAARDEAGVRERRGFGLSLVSIAQFGRAEVRASASRGGELGPEALFLHASRTRRPVD